MRARWGAALVAAAALAASGKARASDDGPCDLGRVDRTRASSRDCMGCHDGSAGPAVPFEMAPGGRGMAHPVETSYSGAALLHPGRYQPEALLPPEIPLVRGRIACTTCHDAASPEPKRVVAVQNLCTACHRL